MESVPMIGLMELLIIVIIAGLTFGLPLAIVLAVVATNRRSRNATLAKWQSLSQGQSVSLRSFSSTDQPIASSAAWQANELVVSATSWSTKALFDVPLSGVDQCLLTFRCRLIAYQPSVVTYLEMWCRIPEKGLFFSRGLDQKIRGGSSWVDVQIPFYLEAGQQADLLHLNIAFEKPGTVRLKDLEVLSTPMKSPA